MKIIFNMMNCGLGNNGGSQTIVLSANTLSKLGHEVYIIDSGRHRYTWDIIEVPHIRVQSNRDIPDADVVIATGVATTKSTIELPDRCGKKIHYIRGWEEWQYSEKQIVEKVLKTSLIKIVNSVCLQKKLSSYGVKSTIIRPGHNFEDFQVLDERKDHEPYVVLGGLYHRTHKTKRTDWIIKAIEILNTENQDIHINLFGADNPPKFKNYYFEQYWKQPHKKGKELIYNKSDIWLSPTKLEGLHIVPQEAMLTECPVVGTDAEMSGMQDFLFNRSTGLVSKNNFDSFLLNIRTLVYDKELRIKLGKAGRQKILELGSREDNMNKLIKYLEGII